MNLWLPVNHSFLWKVRIGNRGWDSWGQWGAELHGCISERQCQHGEVGVRVTWKLRLWGARNRSFLEKAFFFFCRENIGTDAQREANMRACVDLETDHQRNWLPDNFFSVSVWSCSSFLWGPTLQIPCESVVDTHHFCILSTHLFLPQLSIMVPLWFCGPGMSMWPTGSFPRDLVYGQ